MEDANGKIMTQPEKIEYILSKCCEYFGISRDKLDEPHYSSSKLAEKKRLIIGVLKDNTILSYREIMALTGYKTHANVLYHYKLLQNELSDDAYGYDKTKRIYKELLNYLKL